MRALRVFYLTLAAFAFCSVLPATGQAIRKGAAAACPDFREYTQLHWSIALGHAPPRWLVTEDQDGLADRLVNAVSSFIVALITGRALCILPAKTEGWAPQPRLELAYDAPFVDWTCTQGRTAEPVWAQHNASIADMDTIYMQNLVKPEFELYEKFILSDIRSLEPNNATTWRLFIQRGLSIGIFHNLHHADELLRLGLRPDTAFGCILSYLFRPNRETLWQVPKPVLSIMTNPQIIKIGVQIRCGDWMITNHVKTMTDAAFERIAEPYFECARTLERDIMYYTGAKEVKWYLMTDTVALRQKAVQKYGRDKLITFDATSIEFYQAVSASGLRLMAMEHWLLQQAHYHIITETSGLGRTAAFASLRHGSIFTMEVGTADSEFGDTGLASFRTIRGCRLDEHDSLYDVYTSWSGI